MSSFQLLHVRGVTFRSQVLGLTELQFSPSSTAVVHFIQVISGTELVKLPLTALITDGLRVRQARYGLDIQFQGNFRFEPLVKSFVIVQGRIGQHVVIQGLARPYIVSALAIRIVRRTSRVVSQSLLEIRPVVISPCLTVIHVRPDFEPSVKQFEIRVDSPSVILSGIINGDTFVLLIKEGSEDLGIFRSQLQRQVVFLREIVVIDQLFPPIHIISIIDSDVMSPVFIGAQHFRFSVILLLGEFCTISQFGFPVRIRSTLGRNQDNSRSGPCSVNGSGRGILQDINRFHIVQIDGTDITPRKTIDDNQGRTSGIDRSHTTQLDSRSGIRATVVLQQQSTDLTLQGGRNIGSSNPFHHIICGKRSHGTGHLFLLHGSVSYHNHLIQGFRIFGQGDADEILAFYRHLFRLIADK